MSHGPEQTYDDLKAFCAMQGKRIGELQRRTERLEAALKYVDECFSAAIAEGWIDAKENGDIERIQDLWQRRISYAWSNTLNVMQGVK